MNETRPVPQIPVPDSTIIQKSPGAYIRGTFAMLALGLAVTAAVACLCYLGMQPAGMISGLLEKSDVIIWIVIIGFPVVQVIICAVLSVRLAEISYEAARALFLAYCVLTGMAFSILPYVYGEKTMFSVFLLVSVLFSGSAVMGYMTKLDLDRYGMIALAGLVALIAIMLVRFWKDLDFLSLTIGCGGMAILLALTAWDTQKFRRSYGALAHDPELRANNSIFFAFKFYLDYINLFLILRILNGCRGINVL